MSKTDSAFLAMMVQRVSPILATFFKWHCPQRNLQPGDVVILQEDGIARSCWPIGRVEQVFPGDDGLVRIAKVKTAKGIYKRPIVKMVPLILQDD